MTTLGDLAREEVLEFSDGYRTKRNEHATVGFRILRAGDVRDGRIHLDGPDFVDVDYAQAIGSKVAREGDVVLTTKGTVGRAGLVAALTENVVYSPQVCYFRSRRPDVIDLRFLHHWLSSPEFTDQAGYLKSSTDMAPYISLRDLASTRIELPPLPTQRAIAEVLGALDDKIAANDQVSRQADLLAAALTERRLLLLRPIEEVAEVVMGTSPKGETLNESGDGVEFFQGVRDFGMRVPSSRVFTTAPIKMAGRGDLLISVRAPVGTINRADRDLCVGRGLAAARSRTPNVLFHALRRASTWQAFNGEGTVFGSINQTDLRRTPIPWAEDEVITALERTLEPIEQRIDQAQAESRHLATLRDTLLPHLMSGRITVRDAEKQVAQVL